MYQANRGNGVHLADAAANSQANTNENESTPGQS